MNRLHPASQRLAARISALVVALAFQFSAAAQQTTNSPGADAWTTNAVQFPAGTATNLAQVAEFENLHVEAVARKLKVVWPKAGLPESASVALIASAGDYGHWPARDWHTYPMTKRGVNWEANPPVDNVDVPVLFFITVSNANAKYLSPMRVCRPRGVGLEEPSRIFSPFLEGFEEQLEGWSIIDPGNAAGPLKKSLPPKNGKAALSVALAEGKNSVTVASTRARGWQIEERAASGLRVWLRTKSGTGTARFTLLANARSTNQVVMPYPKDFPLTAQWQKIDLPFSELTKPQLGEIDLLTVEFTSAAATEFLLDDLQLLGAWKLLVE